MVKYYVCNMKIASAIFCLIFLSCGGQKTEIPQDILSKNSFIGLLKDIHLAEAKFELHKTKGMGIAKNELAHNYNSIYLLHHYKFYRFHLVKSWELERCRGDHKN